MKLRHSTILTPRGGRAGGGEGRFFGGGVRGEEWLTVIGNQDQIDFIF